MLKQEFEYFLAHKDELVKKYLNKYLVIKDQQVIGSYDDQQTAYFETQKTHEIGTFLIQLASPDEAAYTQTFRSRVSFAK